MISQFSEPLLNYSTAGNACLIAGAAAVIVVFTRLSQRPKLDDIPTVGYSHSWLGSWWDAFKNAMNFSDVIQQGYERHKSTSFKVSRPGHWVVVLNNRAHIEELSSVPDDVASLAVAIDESLSIGHILGPDSAHIDGQVAVIRSQLTRSIGRLYPDLRDEITTASEDVLDLKCDEWTSVPVLHVAEQIVCRASGRIFVGLPLCRDSEWIDLNIKFATDIVREGVLVALFPKWMRSLAAYFLARGTLQHNARALKLLEPMIKERLKYFNDHGKEWEEEPSDAISWLIEESRSQHALERYVTQVLLVGFASIQTTSSSLTVALLCLAAHPEYIQPIREEIESIVEKEGWSKDSVAKMHKVDSFLKECQRREGTNPVGLARMTLKDVVLSDGTVIPKGTMMAAASRSLHYDEACYEDAHAFKPFRFVDVRAGADDKEGVHRQFVSTSVEFLPFGHGRHACPGRFFAANELKTIFAHLLVTYDIKFGVGAAQQPTLFNGAIVAANPHGRLLFRKRAD